MAKKCLDWFSSSLFRIGWCASDARAPLRRTCGCRASRCHELARTSPSHRWHTVLSQHGQTLWFPSLSGTWSSCARGVSCREASAVPLDRTYAVGNRALHPILSQKTLSCDDIPRGCHCRRRSPFRTDSQWQLWIWPEGEDIAVNTVWQTSRIAVEDRAFTGFWQKTTVIQKERYISPKFEHFYRFAEKNKSEKKYFQIIGLIRKKKTAIRRKESKQELVFDCEAGVCLTLRFSLIAICFNCVFNQLKWFAIYVNSTQKESLCSESFRAANWGNECLMRCGSAQEWQFRKLHFQSLHLIFSLLVSHRSSGLVIGGNQWSVSTLLSDKPIAKPLLRSRFLIFVKSDFTYAWNPNDLERAQNGSGGLRSVWNTQRGNHCLSEVSVITLMLKTWHKDSNLDNCWHSLIEFSKA